MKSLSLLLFPIFLTSAFDFGADFGNSFFDINIDRDHPDAIYKEFEDFIVKYKRNYKDAVEKQFRFQQFSMHHNNIGKLNKQASKAGHGVTYAINKFADLTKDEINSMYANFEPVNDPNVPAYKPTTRRVKRLANGFPDNFDLREERIGNRRVIGTPRNQGNCSCCWAFAASALAEIAYSVHMKKLITLSDQEICDCAAQHGPGCGGGFPIDGLKYIKDVGVSAESKYPYNDQRSYYEGMCAADHMERKLQPYTLDFYSISAADAEHEIMEHLFLRKLPVSAIFKVGDAFGFYQNGTIQSEDCETAKKPHYHSGVIVGYGTELNARGKKTFYWIFRNSWGTDWGDGGYARIVRGVNWCHLEERVNGAHVPE